MRVVTTQKQTKEGLQGIRRDLRASLGQPTASSWKYLADLGIMLLLYRDRRFLSWNGIAFIKSLTEAGVAIH